MKSEIYRIINTVNNKFYIGSSKDLKRRKKQHFMLLSNGNSHSKVLQNAVNKYGIDNFKFEILVECIEDLLFTIEQKLVNELKPEYNICIKDVSVPTGLPCKDKTLCKRLAQERLKSTKNFGWKSRIIIKLNDNGEVLKEYPSLKSYAEEHSCAIGNVGKCLKEGTKCKGFYIKYKEIVD